MRVLALGQGLAMASTRISASQVRDYEVNPKSSVYSHTRPAGVLIEHKPSTKREARRERKARKIARTCGRRT